MSSIVAKSRVMPFTETLEYSSTGSKTEFTLISSLQNNESIHNFIICKTSFALVTNMANPITSVCSSHVYQCG